MIAFLLPVVDIWHSLFSAYCPLRRRNVGVWGENGVWEAIWNITSYFYSPYVSGSQKCLEKTKALGKHGVRVVFSIAIRIRVG